MVNILWTGGWDSTYRILELIFIYKKKVQPYYIKDSLRQSQSIEIKTMKKIIKLISDHEEFEIGLLRPIKYVNVNDIKDNEIITNSFKSLVSKSFMGYQYEWLARFSKEFKRSGLELSIHRDDKASQFILDITNKQFIGGIPTYCLNENVSQDEKNVFGNFSFPLLHLSKTEMLENANKYNFGHIMKETWFCHTPLPNGKPCGVCNPCKYTREEGLMDRVPNPNKFTYLLLKYQNLIFRLKRRLLMAFNIQ